MEQRRSFKMAKQTNWSREELIIALYWYCTKLTFSKIKYTRKEVVELAALLGRTPSAAAFKLVNFARLDPTLQERGVKGMSNGSKLEVSIWSEFYNDWGKLAAYAYDLIGDRILYDLQQSEIENEEYLPYGKEQLREIRTRVNQSFFRRSVLLSYGNRCCITGLGLPSLLVASHIMPWSKSLADACNPQNGLCLNSLHDRAFDSGLISIKTDYSIILSREILDNAHDPLIETWFLPYGGKRIMLPERFLPQSRFIQYHNERIFRG